MERRLGNFVFISSEHCQNFEGVLRLSSFMQNRLDRRENAMSDLRGGNDGKELLASRDARSYSCSDLVLDA